MAIRKKTAVGSKKYFIRPQGKGEFKVYQLVNARTFEIVDAFFNSPVAASQYAKRRGMSIVLRPRS